MEETYEKEVRNQRHSKRWRCYLFFLNRSCNRCSVVITLRICLWTWEAYEIKRKHFPQIRGALILDGPWSVVNSSTWRFHRAHWRENSSWNRYFVCIMALTLLIVDHLLLLRNWFRIIDPVKRRFKPLPIQKDLKGFRGSINPLIISSVGPWYFLSYILQFPQFIVRVYLLT